MAQRKNKFAGHIEPDDPRSLLFGARGSIWPTIPPYRWRAVSSNATGSYAFLNEPGLLLPLFSPLPATGDVTWYFALPVPPDGAVFVQKLHPAPARPGFMWVVGVTPEIDTGFDVKFLARPLSKTNVDIEVGSIARLFPWAGDTGSTFRMRQIVWDQTDVDE